jgi:hypothetical protein
MAPKDADAISPDGRHEPVASPASREELQLVARLRSGDEAAFVALVDRHGRAMLRLARTRSSGSSFSTGRDKVSYSVWYSAWKHSFWFRKQGDPSGI